MAEALRTLPSLCPIKKSPSPHHLSEISWQEKATFNNVSTAAHGPCTECWLATVWKRTCSQLVLGSGAMGRDTRPRVICLLTPSIMHLPPKPLRAMMTEDLLLSDSHSSSGIIHYRCRVGWAVHLVLSVAQYVFCLSIFN